MAAEGWIRLDTPEAMNSFRHKHYLFVYTMALQLTDSPAEAHRLATQVFFNISRRFASRSISPNCEPYLAAQVNLLYSYNAQKKKSPAFAREYEKTPHQHPVSVSLPKASFPPKKHAPSATACKGSGHESPAAADARQSPSAAAPLTPAPAPSVSAALEPSVVIQSAANPQPPATARAPEVSILISVNSPGQGYPPNTTVPVAITPLAPLAPPATLGTAAAAPQEKPLSPRAKQTPSVPQTKVSPVPPASETPDAHPEDRPKAVVYNPDDTEFWLPDGDTHTDTVVEEPPEPKRRSAAYTDRPSSFLSIFNGLLILTAVALLGYILYRLNIIPKLF